jgi:hypothetical protein
MLQTKAFGLNLIRDPKVGVVTLLPNLRSNSTRKNDLKAGHVFQIHIAISVEIEGGPALVRRSR